MQNNATKIEANMSRGDLLKAIATTCWHNQRAIFKDIPNVTARVSDDMAMMHDFYGIRTAIEGMDSALLQKMFEFRLGCLQEELDETKQAWIDNDADGVVDGLIDLVVFAVGTLDLYGVDFDIAWNRVLEANMTKKVGIKESRPNPFGLPDLIKLPEFVNPDHSDNTALLGEILSQ